MEDQTVAVDGLESKVSADNLREIKEQVDLHGSEPVKVGNLVAYGDGFLDNDGYIINTAEEEFSGRIQFNDIELPPEIPEFGEFVESEFHLEALADMAFSADQADVDVTTKQPRDVLGSRVGRQIDQSDDVELAYVAFGKNGDEDEEDRQLRIGLKDTRDEE